MTGEFRTLERKAIYEDDWIRVVKCRISRRGSPGSYTVIDRSDSVVIIPLSPSRKTILLKQYRYPTNMDSWEFPMGGVDENETPEETARRELLEEANIVSTHLKCIGRYYAVPGLSPQKVSVFIAKIDIDELTAAAFNPTDADEIREIMLADIDEINHMVVRGEITDGFTLVSLLYLRNHNGI